MRHLLEIIDSKFSSGVPYWDWTEGVGTSNVDIPDFARESQWINGDLPSQLGFGDITER